MVFISILGACAGGRVAPPDIPHWKEEEKPRVKKFTLRGSSQVTDPPSCFLIFTRGAMGDGDERILHL